MEAALRQKIRLALEGTTDRFGIERLAAELLKRKIAERFPGHTIEPRGGSGDAGIDLLLHPADAKGNGTIVGQVSTAQNWRKKLNQWLRDVESIRPDTSQRLFITTRRAGSGLVEKQIAACKDRTPSRTLHVLDQDWFVDALDGERDLLREYLAVEADPSPSFLTADEYSSRLGQRTFSRLFGGRLSFFSGRQTELDSFADLLDKAEVALVVGAGGIGKSRFAVEASRHAGCIESTGGAPWRFVRPGCEQLTQRSLLDLPPPGPMVIVMDDAHRQSLAGPLRLLRGLLDEESRAGLRLVLTTRPGHEDAVRRVLEPEAPLRIDRINLPPLPRKHMNRMLQAPPLAVGNEPARAHILELARGFPTIAEAIVHVYREGGGLPALRSGRAVWALVDSELRRLPEGLLEESVRRFLAIIACAPGVTVEELESAGGLHRLSREELRRALEHLCATGVVQEGVGYEIHPDILAESIAARVMFDGSRQGTRLAAGIWSWLPSSRENIFLERISALAAEGGPAEASDYLGEIMEAKAKGIASADNAARAAILPQIGAVARALPDLALQVVHQILDHPSPVYRDRSDLGFELKLSHSDILDSVPQVLAPLLSCPEEHGMLEALGLLLRLVEERDRVHLPSAGRDRKLADSGAGGLLRRVFAPEWGWVPGQPPDLAAGVARMRILVDWFQEDPRARGRLCGELIGRAAEPHLSAAYTSAESKEKFRLTHSNLSRAPGLEEYYDALFEALARVLSHGDPPAQPPLMESLTRLARCSVIRGTGMQAPLDPDLQDLLYQKLEALFRRIHDEQSRLGLPERQRLFEDVLAFLRNSSKGLQAAGSSLFEALRCDAERRLHKDMGGGSPLCDVEGDPQGDSLSWADRHERTVSNYVRKIGGSEQALETFLVDLAAVSESEAATGGLPGQVPAEVLQRIARASPALGLSAVEQIVADYMPVLGKMLVSPLVGLWQSAPDQAETLCRRLMEEVATAREAVAVAALAGETIDVPRWEILMELARKGPKPVHRILLQYLHRMGEQDAERALDLVVELGTSCDEETLAALIERTGKDRRAWPLPAGRENELDPLILRLLDGRTFPWDGLGLQASFNEFAARAPGDFAHGLGLRIERYRRGEDVTRDPLPQCVLLAARELPKALRAPLVDQCERWLRSGEIPWIAERLLRHTLTPDEGDGRCRQLIDEDAQDNLVILRVLLPRLPKERFHGNLAKLAKKLHPEAERELMGAVREYTVPSGQVHAGHMYPRFERTRAEFEPWLNAQEAVLRSFGKKAIQRLAQWAEDNRRHEEHEYEW